MPRSINRCPNCREPVSPFAAGCAICGTDLEAARKELEARRSTRTPPTLPLPRTHAQIDWAQVIVAYLLALGLSPIGLILAIYWGNQRRNAGETVMMWLMIGAAALSVAALVAPVWFWSHIY